jgi:hypothetical protein
MCAWAVSLHSIQLRSLGSLGLAPALPVAWWISLGVLVLGASILCVLTRPKGWLIACYIAAILVVLYATLPAITDAPQYAWTYKHIGVARLIGQLGTTMPEPDIYNRWPGLFSLAAAFSRLTGVDPLSYAAWGELLFSLLDAALVGAIALTVVRNVRVAGMSVLFFVLCNWVGQSYFSPQALSFTLDLALVLIAIRGFSTNPQVTRTTVLAEYISGQFQRPQRLAQSLRWPSDVAAAVVLALGVAIAATHQLTPILVVLQIGLLTWLGFIRPRLLWVALAGIAIAYLIPNFGYVNSRYGLLSGLIHPLHNFLATPEGPPLYRPFLGASAPILLTLFVGLIGVFGAWRMLRQGRGHRAIPLAALAIVPFSLAFAQSYGGEATLRVFLFASPFFCILGAWGLSTLRPSIRITATLGTAMLAAALFVFAFFGKSAANVFSKGEVRASEYYYAHAPNNATLELANQAFPTQVGPRYIDVGEDYLQESMLAHGPSSLPDVAAVMRHNSPAFLAFSSTQERYASVFRTTPPGALEALENSVAHSPDFRLWYATGDARIYELAPPPPPPPPFIKLGDRGPAVVAVQQALGIKADGVYEASTRDAVVDFQRSHGLADGGIVDTATQQALFSQHPPSAPQPPPPRR